jgi:hypothetical protein
MPVERITAVTVAATSTPPAGPYDLTTLAIAKVELGIASGVTTYDTQLSRYITAASVAAAQYCNRVFVAETVADRFDISFPRMRFGGERFLQASRWPVIAMTSLVEQTTVLVKDTDYRVDQSDGTFWRLDTNGDPTTWGKSPVVATYEAGYTDAANLAVLQDATLRMVRARWNAKDRDPYLKSEDIPGVRTATWWIATGSEAGNMPPDVVDLLDNYRVPAIA